MLDQFEVLTSAGVVLWSRSYSTTPAALLNAFIRDVLIEENVSAEALKETDKPYQRDGRTFRWTSVKELGLVFIAVYESLLQLSWVDKLLQHVRVIFVELYGEQLRKPHTSIVECPFDLYFDQQLKELEPGANGPQQEISVEKAQGIPIKGTSRRARKGVTNGPLQSDEKKTRAKRDVSKKMRTWNDDGTAEEADGTILDYSSQPTEEATRVELNNMTPVGTRTRKGQFVLKDLDDEVHTMLQDAKGRPAAPESHGLVGAISGLFRNVVGGKVLTSGDLQKSIKGMQEHLLRKNVAPEATMRLCEGVEKELLGIKTANFESVDSRIRVAMEDSLRKMLTPTTSLDILRSINAVTCPPRAGPLSPKARPYVISIVGVNGVGKSTNLSKLAFFLLQNKLSLLIAACDTFRSGAVEQLRVHARNLRELSEREGLATVELYERGYGKDAANIAKDAVAYAAANAFDVVLIDTAGRRHNDTRLMSSLEKFAQFAKPDKILMVGEALVGSDSVAQARSFNQAFGLQRHLDGFIISKCDTVGDMVGSLVSMVHATGIPVVFLGVGQHYGDLRTLVGD